MQPEYGAEYSGLENSVNDLGSEWYIAADNVARDDGRIDGFTVEEQDLIDYVKTIMQLREDYSVLWNGINHNMMITEDVILA